MKSMRSSIRWIPHPLMPADMMTHADPGRSNAALTRLARARMLCWDDRTIAACTKAGRSKSVSRQKLLEAEEREGVPGEISYLTFLDALIRDLRKVQSTKVGGTVESFSSSSSTKASTEPLLPFSLPSPSPHPEASGTELVCVQVGGKPTRKGNSQKASI